MVTMKRTDIKKLKVAELRSKLKEVGLDTKGLKTELVDRLWSALNPGAKTELTTPDDSSLADSTPTETAEVRAPSSQPTGTGISAPCKAACTRELTNTATQTEPSATTPQPGSEDGSELTRGKQTDREVTEDPVDANKNPFSEEICRGRAFYEFKEEIRYKRAKPPQPVLQREEAQQQNNNEVRLDPYGGHLHFEVSTDGSCGQPRFWAQFPSLWSGCRLTHGVLQGRVGFEVRLERKLLPTHLEEQQDTEHYGLRVGWSVSDSSLMLGEDHLSFAYDGCGNKVSGGKKEQFGENLSEGDIIGCYASFSTDGAVQLSFHKNGRFIGVAFSLAATELQGRPLFPHVICKSCSVRFHLDPTAPAWYPCPPGFTLLTALPARQQVRTTLAPFSTAQCEVVLMVGLPGSGKSHWSKLYMKQHPEKQYKLLGTEELLTCMISGGQRDSKLRQAAQCLTELIKVAAQTPGNYILDQCNILFSARNHKLQLFTGFRRVVVVTFPSTDEWKRRLAKHQMGNSEQIPETALLKLQLSCSLPEQQCDLQDELQYVELPQEQAQILLKEYKDEARRLLPPFHKEEKRPRLHKKRPYPHVPPSSHRSQWSRINASNDTRFGVQSWNQQPRYSC